LTSDEAGPGWSEADSRTFIEIGGLYTPERDEIGRLMADLVPEPREQPAYVVDLAAGEGWLTEAVLERYPHVHAFALDATEAMLRTATERLSRFGDRVEFLRFQFEEDAWLESLPEGIWAFVSSLAVHHLNGAGKRDLYRQLYHSLAPGGTLLICDLVEPRSEVERAALAESWDREVLRQSKAQYGDDRGLRRFQEHRWNLYHYPDPDFDMPSTIPEHLSWLEEAGYVDSNVFWLKAGHAVYGGYRPLS
jgi:tRNA (cmo5U34)-methyltransferase